MNMLYSISEALEIRSGFSGKPRSMICWQHDKNFGIDDIYHVTVFVGSHMDDNTVLMRFLIYVM